jgi:hypothetical protein
VSPLTPNVGGRGDTNGTIYVYESHSYWDKEKKQPRNKRVCIGKRDPETGEIIYSKRFEQEIPETIRRGRKPQIQTRRVFYGATYLLDQIGEKTGLTEDLARCFPESYKMIQSLAYFLVLEGKSPMSRFPKWDHLHLHPYGKNIPSQRSSGLFSQIDEASKMAFFKCLAERRQETEYLAYDTTSISSYSQSLKQVKFGKNKDHDPLPQINLALIYGEKSNLLVYYRKLAGNITDVKTVRQLLQDLDFLKIHQIKLIMDRGFYSEDNINDLYKHHYKFLIASRIFLKMFRGFLNEIRPDITNRKYYHSSTGLYIQTFPHPWNYRELKPRSQEEVHGKRRMYIHFYYNDQVALDERKQFYALLDQLETELLEGTRKPEHEKAYPNILM